MSEESDPLEAVAAELRGATMIAARYSSKEWNRDERLIGDVRAIDIVRLCDFVMASRSVQGYFGIPQCTCNQPTRFGYCSIHEADR